VLHVASWPAAKYSYLGGGGGGGGGSGHLIDMGCGGTSPNICEGVQPLNFVWLVATVAEASVSLVSL